jgi:hypothetical protein
VVINSFPSADEDLDTYKAEVKDANKATEVTTLMMTYSV